jgi:hypothetical protein
MKVTKEQIDEVFQEAKKQKDYVLGLYRLVHPDWDNIKEVTDFPKAGTAVSQYIWESVLEWDWKNVVTFRGGAWLNSGFTTDNELDPWEIAPGKVKYK